MGVDHLLKDLLQLLLADVEVDLKLQLVALHLAVYKAQILRDDLVEQEASQCGLHDSCLHGSVRHGLCHAHLDA